MNGSTYQDAPLRSGYRGIEYGFDTKFDAKPNSYSTVVICTPTADEYRGGSKAVFPMTSTVAGIVGFNDLVTIKRMHGGRGANHPLNNTGELNATPMSVSAFNLTLRMLTEGKIDEAVSDYSITPEFFADKGKELKKKTEMFLSMFGLNKDYDEMYKSSVDNDLDGENKFSLKKIVNEFSLLGVSVSVNHAISGADGNNGIDFVTSGDVMTKDYWSAILASTNTTKVDPSYFNTGKVGDEDDYLDTRNYTPTIYKGDHLGFVLKKKTKKEIIAQINPRALDNKKINKGEYKEFEDKVLEYFEVVPAIKRANGYITCEGGSHFFDLGKCAEQKVAMFNSPAIHNDAASEYSTDNFIKVLVSQTHNI